MAWRVVVEDQHGASVIDVHRKFEDAIRQAKRIALAAREMGAARPKVHVVRTESSDQLQTYANGTKAVRDQPDLPAIGQDLVLYAPCAEASARAPKPRSIHVP